MENPILDNNTVQSIKSRFDHNDISVKDLQNLDYFLSAVNLENYIKRSLEKRNIYSYESYIDRKNKGSLDPIALGYLEGVISQCLSILIDATRNNM